MEILEWVDKTFHEIPEQDNPAFDSNQECLMIVRDVEFMFGVLEVKDQVKSGTVVDRVRHLGTFWDISVARIFADAYAAHVDAQS